MKYKGFTLAEVLITLTVIGVLAAILTPVLQNAVPDPNIALFRKAYNIVVTAVTDMINDEESYPSNVLGSTTNPTMSNVPVGFYNLNIVGTLVPAFLQATDGTQYPPNKFCYLFSQEINTIGNEICPTLYGNGTFSTRNGMSWTIVDPGNQPHQFPLDGNLFTTRIVVDVNGPKEPNCSYIALNGPNYNNPLTTQWPACDPTKVWPSNPGTGVANPNGIVPDIYDIGVRYDGKIQVNLNDKAAAQILSSPGKNVR